MSECTIIVCAFRSKYSAYTYYGTESLIKKESVHVLYNMGEECSEWRDGEWETIFRNLQIDKTRDLCRIIVFSDNPMVCPEGYQGFAWTPEEMSQIKNICDIHAGQWSLNGVNIPSSKWMKFFPVEKGKEPVYITTFPAYTITVKQKKSEGKTELYLFLENKAYETNKNTVYVTNLPKNDIEDENEFCKFLKEKSAGG